LGGFLLVNRYGATAQESTPAAGVADPATEAAWTKFNLNSATDEQLLTIPGVTDRMLDEFKEYRPYANIEQFREEIGKYVSEEEVAAYERYVFAPVDPSQANEASLQQIPGVSSDDAAALVTGVPYADEAALLAALAGCVSAEQLASAPAFLSSTAGPTATWTLFNLNTASDEQLLTIPAVTDQMLDEFREYRPYSSILQFRQEIGKYVSEKEVAAYEQYVFVPIDPAQVDEATLQQLPGVDGEVAAAVAGAGSFADAAALLAELSKHISAEQAAAAAGFIAS
jgi:DNA uptake protein ComE-like DNA-binding protein